MNNEHGGDIWQAQQIFGREAGEFIDFSANINPLGPSPQAIRAICESLPLIRHYPEPQSTTLRNKLACINNIGEENLILGNGVAELIYTLGRVLKFRRILMPMPSFSEYTKGFKGPLKSIPLEESREFVLDIAGFTQQIKANDLVIICNPNNPTGNLMTREDLLTILDYINDSESWFVVDEAFMDFVDSPQTLIGYLRGNPRLIVLRSLTKFYAIPGLRLGYLAAAPEIVNKLYEALPPWRVNSLAQVAAMAGLADYNYHIETRDLIKSQKESLFQSLKNIPGLYPYYPQANFILVRCDYNVPDLQAYLGKNGILIRNCANFPGLGDNYFRVAVRTEEENRVLIKHLLYFMRYCI